MKQKEKLTEIVAHSNSIMGKLYFHSIMKNECFTDC